MTFILKFLTIFTFLTTVALGQEEQSMVNDPENSIKIELTSGDVYIELLPDVAPGHVDRIKELARGGSSKPDLKAEFNNTSHLRGTVSMARTAAPDSANSQFFICFGPTPHLDGQYTVFGQVVKGMEFIDSLKKGSGGGGEVTDPDKMISVKVVADI
jgi:cyclophilin family peptidyl-prolyl cis-trans isomerase